MQLLKINQKRNQEKALKINNLIYLYMDRLNNIAIRNADDATYKFDFAHSIFTYADTLNTSLVGILLKNDKSGLLSTGAFANNKATMQSNEQYIADKLGINKLIYGLTQASINAGNSAVLKEKLTRANNIKDVIVNFVLSLIHAMYWIEIPKKRSTLGLNQILTFALDIGKHITTKFETILDKEYDISKILENQYGKGYKNLTK